MNNVQVANQRLSSFTNAAMRNVLASASRDAIVRTQREGLMNRIQEDVNRQAKNLGIEIVDLRLTRVDLPAANSQAVYQRMRTEREREAAELRANGNQVAATIKAKADRDVTVLLAEANQKADQLRGQGEADRNRILRGLRAGPGLLRLLPVDAGLREGPERVRHAAGDQPRLGVLPLLQRPAGAGPPRRGSGGRPVGRRPRLRGADTRRHPSAPPRGAHFCDGGPSPPCRGDQQDATAGGNRTGATARPRAARGVLP